MKQLIVPIAIIVALIAFFVIIDRKEFSRHDDVQSVQSESPTSNRKPTVSVPETKPVIDVKPAAGTKPVEMKPVVETKPAEVKPVAETKPAVETKPVVETKPAEAKPVEAKPAETKPVAQSKPEENLLPAAVPVVTAEEAEKLNAEAIVAFEILEKIRAKQRKRLDDGYGLTYSDVFNGGRDISLSKANEEHLLNKGYDLEEFKKRQIPQVWSIDFSTIPSDALFQNVEGGFKVISDQGLLRLICKRFDGMRSSFIFEFSIKNDGDSDCEISFGIHNSGLVKSGYIVLASDKISAGEIKQFEAELSVFDQLTSIAPTLAVRGSAILESFNVYQKLHDDFTIVEGEIIERSTLPDPKDTDYPDCRYTAHFVGNAIISGLSCNKELSLSIDGFHNKSILNTNSLKVGDKIKCAIVPFDSVPDNLASIQEADELSLFTLDNYLATTIQKISSYTDTTYLPVSSTHFKSDAFDFKSVFEEKVNPPIADKLILSQKERIRKDLEAANEMLQTYESAQETTESFFQEAWAKEKERFPDGFNTIKNGSTIVQYWRNINHSFWCLPPQYTLIPETLPLLSEDKLNALVSFKDFLEANGIQFIVSLVPDRYDIASRVINSDFSDVPVYQLLSYVKQLSEAGIECPYYPPAILKHFDLFPFGYSFPNDGHCNSSVQYSIAEVLADRLSPFNFAKNLESSKFSHVQAPTFYDASTHAHQYPENCDIEDHEVGTCYTSDEIHYDGQVLTKDPSSEIYVVGNSFMQTPMGASQNSLPAFLSERMLCTIDDYRVDQKGPMTTIIQRFFDNPSHFLIGKKVLVMQVASNYLSDNSFTWNNIRTMDDHRTLLNGKKLVSTLSIKGEGDFAREISNSDVQVAWERFAGKHEIIINSDEKREILRANIKELDKTKPFVCIVSTVRSSLFSFPTLSVNGIPEPIPAGYAPSALSWQDVFFSIPAGSTEITIVLQGKKGTIVGFSQVQIYQ